ncbi:mismatch repair endonuclease PMS2 [Harmonia axyridis]|uniref:mismatch repair endonuclease PMS2 n=1 Tax=Harmonia axyridis TaxID=115357 RepID=UPI001E2762C5|nr:mismatch repair endonuclease PMS2 [Harmonia axyridis]
MESNKNTALGLIKPISKDVVHQICSGQIILTLAVAVKELIENSIDAGASIIDVTLNEYGSESIVVCDNGEGVLENNFEALTLKHYTSKIDNFSDLQFLETLGFRGEALSSLSALADLSILTKHASSEQANKIKYNKDGKIMEVSLAARETGTTVKLENLFSTLPVRRKEFLKNLKREFNKMCQLLYAYCLVSKGIKFTCTNVTAKSKKNIIMSTQGHNTVKENIISVFGPKQISSLIEVDLIRPNQDILNEYSIKLGDEEELPFEMEFLVSSVTHGNGRSSTDRQFFYVNSRPVEPTKIIKLVNQIYKQFNVNQYPFVYLNILVKSSIVDVNVTPDKRQIFLEKEKLFLATIKASLLESFKLFPSKVPMENQDISKLLTFSNCNQGSKGMKRSLTDSSEMKKDFLNSFRKKHKSDSEINSEKDGFLFFSKPNIEPKLVDSTKNNKEKLEIETNMVDVKIENFLSRDTPSSSKIESYNLIEEKKVKEDIGSSRDEADEKDILENQSNVCVKTLNSSEEHILMNENKRAIQLSLSEQKITLEKECEDENYATIVLDNPNRRIKNTKSVHYDISLQSIRESIYREQTDSSNSHDIKVKFRSIIAPENNKKAEEELQRQLSKKDFFDMKIIGQFNLGFIITRLGNDLFIIDQHATDEKYNFEQLQASTVLQKQTLVNPKCLELTAGNESILIENEEIFQKNGFHFKIDENAPITKRVLLTAVPVSQNFVFGKDDIDEMLFMLKDSSHTMCRPSRVRAMFASRACRKSVMIGKSLSTKDMKQLIEHMGEIEQPWNCPHGRPTIRHLINMDLLSEDDE